MKLLKNKQVIITLVILFSLFTSVVLGEQDTDGYELWDGTNSFPTASKVRLKLSEG